MKKLDFSVFERYKPIIDDWDAFLTTLSQPLPTSIWTNTLRTTSAHLADILTQDGFEFEEMPWYPGAFKLATNFRPGYHWAFLAGLYHAQEEVSLMPVVLLNPKPGERVLDMCAAPGNKTAQIAIKMTNQGTVIANDFSVGRMRAMRQTIERLGLLNVTRTSENGANYSKKAGLFDKILVDVPCSCEGISRKSPSVIKYIGPSVSLKKHSGQQALLRKAVQLCKPGGRIVYSTCTYAPEENEMVVDAILREFGRDTVRLLPAHIAGVIASEGLTAWHNQTFDQSLQLARRIWPHQNDTGGFFVAVIEKIAEADQPDSPSEPDSPAYPRLAPALWAGLEARFGIGPDSFAAYDAFQRNADRAYIVVKGHQPPQVPEPDAVGTVFLKTSIRYPKMSTAAAMLFGNKATRNILDVTQEQAEAYLTQQTFKLNPEQSSQCSELGYILIRYRDFVLGVAFFKADATGIGGKVQSMFPGGWSPPTL